MTKTLQSLTKRETVWLQAYLMVLPNSHGTRAAAAIADNVLEDFEQKFPSLRRK